ncbi:MAG TPA: transcription antitermination factor NusB [Thermoleophilaceae bacterium]
MRRADQRRAAVVALYQHDSGRPIDQVIPKDASSFTRELVDGVLGNQGELDALIERYAQGWTLDRIAPLERSILRTALYEILHRTDVPDEVAIDEAVEAAKELCAAEAPGFVNGILGAVKRTEVTSE